MWMWILINDDTILFGFGQIMPNEKSIALTLYVAYQIKTDKLQNLCVLNKSVHYN